MQTVLADSEIDRLPGNATTDSADVLEGAARDDYVRPVAAGATEGL
jgi:hypothetical protein